MTVTCSPWITGVDVAECCAVDCDDPSQFDNAAIQASDILFQLSARQFAGTCEQTVRPCRTQCDCWGFQVLSRGHIVWGNQWGWWGWNYWTGDCWENSCGCTPLSTVTLAGYPVQAVTEVLIDGAVVDPATYRLDRQRNLVRVSDPPEPDVALRWPACQNMALPDTEEGTFSVTYTYGRTPPAEGVAAAGQLACEIYKACIGQECALPSGITRIARQGVVIEKPAFVTWGFQSGKSRGLPRGWVTGLPLVDNFLNAHARNGLSRRPTVWSPAVGLQYPTPAGT